MGMIMPGQSVRPTEVIASGSRLILCAFPILFIDTTVPPSFSMPWIGKWDREEEEM